MTQASCDGQTCSQPSALQVWRRKEGTRKWVRVAAPGGGDLKHSVNEYVKQQQVRDARDAVHCNAGGAGGALRCTSNVLLAQDTSSSLHPPARVRLSPRLRVACTPLHGGHNPSH